MSAIEIIRDYDYDNYTLDMFLIGYGSTMDQLVCFIQQRGSMCQKILFSIFIVLTVIGKCTLNQEICTISNKRNVTYFEANIKEANWNAAWQECMKQLARLPIICNKEEQDTLINYLKGIGVNSTVWTAGKSKTLPDWTWINRQRFKGRDGFILTREQTEYNTHAALNQSLRYKSANPGHKNYYLCQDSDSQCSSGNLTRVTNGCVRASDDDRTFYDARNQCLMNGGDLAILNDADLITLNGSKKLDARNSYWIGLSKNTWHWIHQQTAYSSEIKYTDWPSEGHYKENECISINTSDGKWKPNRCADEKKIICERISDMSSTLSSTAMPSSTASTAMSTSNMQSATEIPNMMSIYAAASAAIVVLVICIIVIILIVRYKRKSDKDKDRLKDNKQSDRPKSSEFANKPSSKSPANAPVNAAVTKAEDVGGVYAEIPLARLSQAEEGAQTQQPGLVYASLEFQKEPTYMEPNTKRDSADRTKVGPMGDIYAMPDAKGGVVTSPGSESESHPFKVSPQGDVYALPVKDSKSPTSKTPGGAIYANT